MSRKDVGWIDAEGKAHKLSFTEMADGSWSVRHMKEDGDYTWRKLNEMCSSSSPQVLNRQEMTPQHLKDKEALI